VPSYLAVLNTRDAKGDSVFSIVETNPFKYLTHLSLQFFPGDDASIKSYLAARLAQVNAEKKALSTNLGQTSSDLRHTKHHESELEKRLDTLLQQTESELARDKMKFSDDLNAEVSETYHSNVSCC
jgi:spindle assembly abnormal protein 6